MTSKYAFSDQDPTAQRLADAKFATVSQSSASFEALATERNALGVALLDSAHLDDYLLYLMDCIAQASARRSGRYLALRNSARGMEAMAVQFAGAVAIGGWERHTSPWGHATGEQSLARTSFAYSDEDGVLLDDMDALVARLRDRAVEMFFSEVFWNLDFQAGYTVPPVEVGREIFGMADADRSVMGSFLAGVIERGLRFIIEVRPDFAREMEQVADQFQMLMVTGLPEAGTTERALMQDAVGSLRERFSDLHF